MGVGVGPGNTQHLLTSSTTSTSTTTEMRISALLLLLMIATALAFPLTPAEDGAPLIRRKRFIDITGLVPTIFRASFFPTPFFPTNFIGLQVTLPAPKIKRRVRG